MDFWFSNSADSFVLYGCLPLLDGMLVERRAEPISSETKQ